MAKSKADIEAEIARLRAQLEHVEIDPAFTPSELVRWDPTLQGALLHIQHYRGISGNAFNIVGVDFTWDSYNGARQPTPLDITQCRGISKSLMESPECRSRFIMGAEGCMESFGVLQAGGCYTHVGMTATRESITRAYTVKLYEGCNNFTVLANHIQHPPAVIRMNEVPHQPKPEFIPDLSCKDYGLKLINKSIKTPDINYSWSELHIPLANPERPLLDQIFVASSTRMGQTDVIIDRYPLSTLYKEWKRDKEASRGLWLPLRRTDFDKAKALIAELQGEVRALQAARRDDEEAARDLADKNERLREALHIAVQTPNMGGFVPVGNAIASDFTNATASASASATASATASASTFMNATADPI